MKGFRVTAFWQAVIVALVAYLLFKYAFPPVLPKTLMVQYMVITLIGILLYFAFDDEKWEEFKSPLLATLRDDNKAIVRWALLIATPLIAGYTSYDIVKPTNDAPVELRQVHPAPPASLKVFGSNHDLATLENPIREEILTTLAGDEQAGWDKYDEVVLAGRDIYYQNCFYCHGDLLDGQGHYGHGFNPQPIDFQDPTIIPQLQEAFLFWRIATGGPGLPKEGTPWNSAMPVWHEMLSEEEIWQVITFIFDYNGQVPRIWDPEISKQVTGMKDRVLAMRNDMMGKQLYQLRCEVCHGESGAGDGIAADLMYPKPRDFSLGLFKYKTSPGTLLPRDEDLFNTIKSKTTRRAGGMMKAPGGGYVRVQPISSAPG
ncbi:MAG: c-type cytochrome, partial [Candidatus Thiodiazotropha taylori]|nr:c-type cytochrome [Candidatus Thiodiazotropha taylori]MCW4307836.1 c-type cytochrome [Candidatus Thiodiazotropha endolucinida]